MSGGGVLRRRDQAAPGGGGCAFLGGGAVRGVGHEWNRLCGGGAFFEIEASGAESLGSAPPRPSRLCLLSTGSTGAVSTFSPGCECGAGSGGEGAVIPRACRGRGRGSVSEDGWGRGAGRIWAPPPSLMPVSGCPTALRTPGSRSWSLCGA